MTKESTSKIQNNRSNSTLVMLSGGIDSTAALWSVLNNPDKYGKNIHVHHIHIQNIEARWRAEAAAVNAVLAYMRKNAPTPFKTSESSINTPHFGGKFLYDAEITSFITGYMTSRDPSITKVIVGATGTDFAMGASKSVARGKLIHNAFHAEKGDHSGGVRDYMLSKLTKEQVYKSLPPDLAELTWSCRTPHYADGKPLECGRCKTCTLETSSLSRPKSAGKRVFK